MIRSGPHPQRVAHQPPDRHLAATFEVRWARLEPHDVRLAEPQLGGILDRDDPLALPHEARQRRSAWWSCRSRCRRRPTRSRGRARRARGSRAGRGPASRSPPDPPGESPWRRKRRIVNAGPSSASGGSTTFTRDPSGSRASHSGSDSSARRPSGARMRSIASRRSASRSKRTPVHSSRPRALHPHRSGAGDHDLVHRRVGQQRLQRPEPERALGDPRRQLHAPVLAQHARLAVHQRRGSARAGRPPRRPLPRAAVHAGRAASASSGSMPHRGAARETSPPPCPQTPEAFVGFT